MTKRQKLDEQIDYAKQIVAELEEKKTTANTSLQEINTAVDTANTFLQEVAKTKEDASTSLQEVAKTKENASTSLQEINTAKDTVKNTEDTSLQEIAAAKENINSNSQEVKEIKAKVETIQNKFETQFKEIEQTNFEVKKIINDIKDKDGNIIEESTKTKIDNFFKKAAEEKEKFDVKKQKTLEEIQDILAKTTSIELTRAYVEAKSKYGSTLIYGNLPKNFCWKHTKKFYHWLKSSSSTIFYYLLFLAPLAVMIFIFKEYFSIMNSNEESGKIDIGLLILRAVISTPLLLISFFGLSSIRMNRKLYEEYNHKHRVMQLYNSFLKELKETGTTEEQQKLREIMLETVQDKSSLIKEKRSKLSKKEKNFFTEEILNFFTEKSQELYSKEP